MNRLGYFTFIIISFALSVLLTAQEDTYTNPIGGISGIGDPFVLKVNGAYYMYCTSAPNIGFKVWQSDNLVDWKERGLAFTNDFPGNGWGTGDFWAPEVIAYDSSFYMTYSARASDGKLKICLAKSASPLGPFVNIKTPLLDDALVCIDGNFLIDDRGTPYLYYAKDCSENVINGKHVSQIYVQQMTPHTFEPVGDPVLCIQPSQSWEHPEGEWQWNEGPFVLKKNGLFYMMYSANFFASPDYAIGYAAASSPMGPWTKFPGNPVLKKKLSIGVSGPGHNSVTTSPDDSELFVVYHTHTDPGNPSGDRQPNIDRVYFSNDSLIIIGPTRSPQPAPSFDRTSIIDSKKKTIDSFILHQNFPNPFNAETVISYQLSGSSFVDIKIYNIFGRHISTLVSKRQPAGVHSTSWDGKGLPTGIYYYRLELDSVPAAVKKMMLLR